MIKLLKNKVLILFSILFLFLISSAYSQNYKIGMEAYENLQYDIATKYLKKAWKKDKDNKKLNYLLGKSILRANTDRREAKKYLEIVIGYDINYKNANLELGKAYMYCHEFKKARQLLNYFIDNYTVLKKEKYPIDYIKEAKGVLKNIETAEILLQNPINISFVNLGTNVNTKRSEFNPFVSKDGRTLYFTSNKKYDIDLLELINNVYYSKFSPDQDIMWSKMKSIGKGINSSENETIVGFSNDEKKLILNVNWMKDEGNIFITGKGRRRFEALIELERVINTDYNEVSATMTKNNDTLYFCSNRAGGYGGQDLYISVLLPDKTWGQPMNLGPEINSEFNESYPNTNETGNILQFSSDRPESMGGYDIFSAKKTDNKWSKPTNLGYPINDFYDNNIISYSKSGKYAYMSRIKDENVGGSDLYQLIFNDLNDPEVVYSGTILKQNEKFKEIIEGSIKIESIDLETNLVHSTSQYTKKGKYTLVFPSGNYKIRVTGSSIQDYEETITVPKNEPEQTVVVKNIIIP